MSRDETLTRVVAAFGQIVDERGVCRGSVESVSGRIANLLGLTRETVRRTFPALRQLGVIRGPLPDRRAGRSGLQNFGWYLLRPGAVIVQDDRGYYGVQPPQT